MPPTVCKHMEKDLIIKDKNIIYIGGNQAWFLPLGYKDICEYGCGIVAVCNFLLCFFRAEYKSGSDISKDTFISFVLSIYKKYFCILNNIFIKGLTGFALAKGINRYFVTNNINMKAKWGHSLNILHKVKLSLQNNRPVILGIGPSLLKKSDGVDAVDIDTGNTVKLYSHYVTIYDCKDDAGDVFFCISSWGRRYKVSYRDFCRYQRSTLLGFLLSNILEI